MIIVGFRLQGNLGSDLPVPGHFEQAWFRTPLYYQCMTIFQTHGRAQFLVDGVQSVGPHGLPGAVHFGGDIAGGEKNVSVGKGVAIAGRFGDLPHHLVLFVDQDGRVSTQEDAVTNPGRTDLADICFGCMESPPFGCLIQHQKGQESEERAKRRFHF